MAESLATKLAVLTSEVMNLAALVRRGDDAAWAGIGPDAHIRVGAELVAFADLAGRAGVQTEHGLSFDQAAGCARVLAEEIMRTGVPVSEAARALASDLLRALGVGSELLHALDGGAS